jgi:hypothetical protein
MGLKKRRGAGTPLSLFLLFFYHLRSLEMGDHDKMSLFHVDQSKREKERERERRKKKRLTSPSTKNKCCSKSINPSPLLPPAPPPKNERMSLTGFYEQRVSRERRTA